MPLPTIARRLGMARSLYRLAPIWIGPPRLSNAASLSPCKTTGGSTARVHSETAPPETLKLPETVLETASDKPEKGGMLQELPQDMSQTPFMRAIWAHGGMDDMSEPPAPKATDKHRGTWRPEFEPIPSPGRCLV
jgi:hypothetical protein